LEKKYTVRPYLPGDEVGIVELLQLVFDGWPRFDLNCSSLDHWRWKYLSNPLDMIFIAVAVNKGRTIGCHHSIPLRIKIGDDLFLCNTGSDLAVHPDFRNMGISKQVRQMCRKLKVEAGLQHAYFVTGNPILIKRYLKSRPSFPHPITNLVRIMDINLHLRMMPVENAWLMKLGFNTVKYINDFRNAFSPPTSAKHDLNIFETRCFDERIDAFWKQVSEKSSFIVERGRDYLNWKYYDPRAGNFVIRQVEENGHIIGYSVLNINRYHRDYPIGYIVDLITLPERPDVADALAKDAVRFFDSKNINIINCQVVKNHPHERIYKRHSFLDSRTKLHLFYNIYGKEDKIDKIKMAKASTIYFYWGDLDVLPVSMPSYNQSS